MRQFHFVFAILTISFLFYPCGVETTSKRAQLFGDLGKIPSSTSGIGGDSSQVIYFKNIFERVSLNQPTSSGAN